MIMLCYVYYLIFFNFNNSPSPTQAFKIKGGRLIEVVIFMISSCFFGLIKKKKYQLDNKKKN